MKRIVLVVAICAVAFLGCKKEEKEKPPKEEEPKLDARLVNTKWQRRDYLYEGFWGGGVAYNVYEFISTTEVENYTKQGGNIVFTYGTYPYTLDYPNGEITEKNFVSKFEIIDSRKMKIGSIEYIKQ